MTPIASTNAPIELTEPVAPAALEEVDEGEDEVGEVLGLEEVTVAVEV